MKNHLLKNRYSKKDIQEIIRLYTIENNTTRQIAKKFNCVHGSIIKILKNNNVARRDALNCRISSGYNRSYFEKIDTEEKAYFLGLLYADGTNSGKGFAIGLQREDEYLIEKFKKALNAEKLKTILVLRNNKNENWKDLSRLSVTSSKMASDLSKLGCVPAKSLILKFPTKEQVPEHLLHHFMRGHFDGDGCVCVTNRKEKGRAARLVGEFNIASSKDYCVATQGFLRKLGINCVLIHPKGTLSKLIIAAGTFQLFKFYNFIYKDASIWMLRKRKKFEALFESQNYRKDGSREGRGHSKYRGVYTKISKTNKKTYTYVFAGITHNRKFIKLGYFPTEIEAAQAYDKMAKSLFGQQAVLNFPDKLIDETPKQN